MNTREFDTLLEMEQEVLAPLGRCRSKYKPPTREKHPNQWLSGEIGICHNASPRFAFAMIAARYEFKISTASLTEPYETIAT